MNRLRYQVPENSPLSQRAVLTDSPLIRFFRNVMLLANPRRIVSAEKRGRMEALNAE